MKKYIIIIIFLFVLFCYIHIAKVNAVLPLSGTTVVIDPGHGGKDCGTSYNKIYEKDINLSVSSYLEEELSKMGALVIMTRTGDYDLAKPNASRRKKSDFDNRINMINNSNASYYLSIHTNYLSDSSYYGPQVFYNNNIELAIVMQEVMNKELNGDRKIKTIPSDTYMYNKLNVEGLLIEIGFLSNAQERNKLIQEDYQRLIASSIAKGLVEYKITK